MAVRAKKANRSRRVDSVRASRDGHQFHEAWVARCALGLLLPRFDLHAIAVEGLSEDDERGAPDAVVEIADATSYHGNGASFETCTRMEVAQFKYSISRADTPLRVADLRKTLAKFAATDKEFVSKHGGDAVARKITYSINTNRPFAPDILEAFRAASTGQTAVAADVDAQLRQLRSVVKQSGDGLKRFASRVLLIGRMDSLEAIERGNARTVADWSVSNDALARARIGEESDSGAALFATRPFLADFLAATDRDLLVLIKLQHYQERERYNPADDDPSDRFTHAYSLLLVDRHLRVRPVVPTSEDSATVASLDKYSTHDFQKRFTALSKSRGA